MYVNILQYILFVISNIVVCHSGYTTGEYTPICIHVIFLTTQKRNKQKNLINIFIFLFMHKMHIFFYKKKK